MKPARIILFCAAISMLPAAQVSDSNAILHIYRQKLEMGVASRPTVSCDNFSLARIPNGRVYTIKASPGWHEIATTDKAPIRVDMKAGNEYFVRIEYPVNAAFSLGATPVLVPAEQGRMEIAGLRTLEGRYIEAAGCGR